MLELEAAVERILSDIAPLGTEEVSLIQAANRYLSEPIVSSQNLPAFDNSAMDGYAVLAADVSTASLEAPVELRCVGETPAGQPPGPPLQSGECWRVFTGSPIPANADAVVMQEDVRIDSAKLGRVQVLDSARPWDNVRFRGEDIKSGHRLAEAGTKIHFGLLASFAAVGLNSLVVGRQPRLALLATGDELVEPGANLNVGQIYESNRTMLKAMSDEVGCQTKVFPIVRDDLDVTRNALATAFAKSDVVISSGGVSVGAHDHVKAAFESLGGRLEFWKIAIRPGKPFVYGRLGKAYFFGLPGNPVSAAVTFLLLVRPALIRFQGGAETGLRRIQGRLAKAIRNPGNRRHFVRAAVDSDGCIDPVGMQGSHVLSGLGQAAGIIDVPPGADWESGRQAEIVLFP
ncbi:molybdopterin molybdenumtransferase MoeA [bacterium]|nr:molybdopterin molybdenumtransferase MoeA [bacterium]